MRLKQLKLAGFKSFANPTTFHFKHTITAIVGPNGCGKSNVIDAVRWVLGESSAKQLRGGAMSDVIFAGSQDKAGKSLASVELVFEHTQGDENGRGGINHALNLYHELSVRRQITKDGKSDYFINGTKVRRRDVVDVFLGTGLGARSYAVIEQGMIGRIIDANALQLREFIEEASGVSRYQNRREETQKQLDTANDNLNRLNDMTHELSVQQKRLEKQAKTATQAQAYQQQIEQIVKKLLINEHFSLYQQRTQLEKKYQTANENLDKKQQVISNTQQHIKDILQQSYEIQIAQQEHQNRYQRHWQQVHEAQTLLAQQQSLAIEHKAKIDDYVVQKQQVEKQIHENNEALQQSQHLTQDLPKNLEKIQKQLDDIKQNSQQLNIERQKIANEISQLHKQKQEHEKQLAIGENSLKNNQQQLAKIQNQLQQVEKERQKLLEVENQMPNHDDVEQQLSAIVDKVQAVESRILHRQEQIAEQMDEVDSLQRQVTTAEQQLKQWQTEQDTLQKLVDNQAEFLQKIKQNQQNNHDLPLLFETLQLSEMGKNFAEKLDTLATVFGQWTMLSVDAIDKLIGQVAAFVQQSAGHAKHSKLPESFVALEQLVESPKLPMFAKIWLNTTAMPLADVGDILPNLADDWLLLWTDTDECWLFSQSYCVNLTLVLQNNQSNQSVSSHRFSQQVRIDALQGLIDKQTTPFARLKQRLQEATISLQEWQAQDKAERLEMTQLNEQKQKLSTKQLEQKHQKDQWQKDKNRLDEQAKQLQAELTQMNNGLTVLQQQHDETAKNLAEIQPILAALIGKRDTFDKQILANNSEQKQQETAVNELTIALTKGQIQAQHQADTHKKLVQQQAQIHTQIEQSQQAIDSLEKNLPNLQNQLASLQNTLADSEENLHNITAEFNQLDQQKQQKQQQLEQLQQDFHQEQQAFYGLETQLALIKQSAEQVAIKIVEQKLIIDGFDENQLLSQQQVDTLQSEQQQLQQKLNQLGAVNYSAVAELNEVNERLLPLAEQMKDLQASIDKLRQAISEIDKQTKELFMAMLSQVNLELNHLFGQVFGGGQAQLVLSEDGNDWQAGLELMAQPKGKKNSRLALLSGGEKTLTALSLIFAIFKQQPAPFCVLDEVDAPLDDANVERFTNLINDLAKDVQFIFISHNKLAMQVADELKGITMPTAGISKLVSVDMKDVAAYLDN